MIVKRSVRDVARRRPQSTAVIVTGAGRAIAIREMMVLPGFGFGIRHAWLRHA
jgi:hypothetical protein